MREGERGGGGRGAGKGKREREREGERGKGESMRLITAYSDPSYDTASTGIISGKFMERGRIAKPSVNPSDQTVYYQAEVSNIIHVHVNWTIIMIIYSS